MAKRTRQIRMMDDRFIDEDGVSWHFEKCLSREEALALTNRVSRVLLHDLAARSSENLEIARARWFLGADGPEFGDEPEQMHVHAFASVKGSALVVELCD